MADHRDSAHHRRWWKSIDHNRMVATVEVGDGVDDEEVEVPIKFEVCPTCDGRGCHVNPNIDRHGLSREDLDEDPDFAEGYMAGQYDVQCHECHGERVVPVCLDEKVLQKLRDDYESRREMDAEMEAERRMGA